jgi:hypothetical protein
MSAENLYRGNHLFRRVLVIAAAILAVALVSLIYLIPRQSNVASGPQASPGLRKGPPPLQPTPTSLWNSPCPPTELSLSGAFQECASIAQSLSCPTGTFDNVRVVRLHGTKHDFLLYVEVNRAYHGPGTYALAPWPHATLGAPDGVAKVAIREFGTGKLWESSAGSLMIDKLEDGGYVYAGLGASSYSPVDVELNIAGWWSCT